MSRRTVRLVLALVLCVSLIPIGAISAFAERSIDGDFPISLAPYGQTQPAIDYPYVVYKSETDTDNQYNDIWGYNLETGLNFPICTVYGEQSNPSIYGTKVVYSDDRVSPETSGECNIFMYDIATGEESQLTSTTLDQGNPYIWGDIVVFNNWTEGPTGGDVHMIDLTTREESAVVDSDRQEYEPTIWENYVAYTSTTYGWSYRSVGLTDIETGDSKLIADATDVSNLYYNDPMVADGKVVWEKYYYNGVEWRHEIQMYDIETEDVETISSSLNSNRWHPEIGDGWVVWQDRRNAGDSNNAEVWGYNYAATEPTETCLVPNVYDAELNQFTQWGGRATVGDGWLVWHDHRDEGINSDGTDYDDLYARWIGGGNATTQETPIEGPTRYETAVEVSKEAFPDGADTVVVASGENWPDALAGASLAGLSGAPVLLVGDLTMDHKATELPTTVADEIERLGASSAYVLGGEEAITAGVQTAVESIVGTDVVRIGGVDRYETSCLIAEEVAPMLGQGWDHVAFVTTGNNWPDALAASPLVANTGWPVFLSDVDGISEATQACMDDLGVNGALVLGGTVAVPVSAFGQLQAAGVTEVDRVGGDTRYETAALISEYGVANFGMSFDTLGIATGQKFPDALSSGPTLGRYGYTMMLTPGTYLHPTTQAAIEAHKDDISRVLYAGGPSAIAQSVRDAVAAVVY